MSEFADLQKKVEGWCMTIIPLEVSHSSSEVLLLVIGRSFRHIYDVVMLAIAIV